MKRSHSADPRMLFFSVKAYVVGILTAILILTSLAVAQSRVRRRPGKNLYAESEPSKPGFAGVVTDSYCGARHDKNLNRSSAECAQFCVRKGAQYSLVDGEKAYHLQGDTLSIRRFAGERARVTGALNGDVISVTSIKSEQ